MKVRFTARAQAELLAQTDWLTERSPEAARRASRAIREKLSRLADFPLAAPAIDAVHRDAAVRFGRDGFFVRYRIVGEVLVVVRVFHGRQDR